MTTSIPSAAAAREAARTILAEGRFHQPSFPTPLHGLLHAVGKVVQAPFTGLDHAVGTLGGAVPGGVPLVWAALALALGAAAALIARRAARARLAIGAGFGAGTRPATAADLQRDAAVAEREARFADAVRLRFRAGLLALAERGQIPSGRTVPTQEVALELGSERFDALAHRFDEIAYGGADAGPDDARQQRDGWAGVLAGDRT